MADALDVRAQNDALLPGVVRFAMGSVGSKVVMALTGLGLWGFVVAHMIGNLAMWGGPDAMNGYAASLAAKPPLVWAVRIALLIGLPLHIWAAIRSTRLNQQARPVAYARGIKTPTSLAGRTMMISGLMVGAFVVYHLAHLTLHLGPHSEITRLADGRLDVYGMVYRAFEVPWIVAIYVVAQLLLAQHLAHGLSALFLHLGMWGKAWSPFIRRAAMAVGWVICLAFISVPLGVIFGVLRAP